HHARVVDEHIDRAPLRFDSGQECGEGVIVSDVEVETEQGAVKKGSFVQGALELVGRFLRRLASQITDGNLRTGRGQEAGDLATDALRATRDSDDFSAEVNLARHFFLLVFSTFRARFLPRLRSRARSQR